MTVLAYSYDNEKILTYDPYYKGNFAVFNKLTQLYEQFNLPFDTARILAGTWNKTNLGKGVFGG